MTLPKNGIFIMLCMGIIASCTLDDDIRTSTDRSLLDLLKSQSPTGEINYYLLPSSSDLTQIPQDPNNSLTKEKIALGGFLFHDPILGTEGKNAQLIQTYSCASCHHADAGFSSGRLQGIGDGGSGFGIKGELRVVKDNIDIPDAQSVRSPFVLNVAFQSNLGWNGQYGATHANKDTKSNWVSGSIAEVNHLGYEGVESRAIAGIKMHRMNFSKEILDFDSYKKLFDASFPEFDNTNRYTNETAALAIAAYLRTITSHESPFQYYLKGGYTALSEPEKQGALLFFGKAKCVTCHTGPALNSMQFHAIGMSDLVDCPEKTFNTAKDDLSNLGRGGFTKSPKDLYAFKVPQLYNLVQSPYYGHGSSMRSIKAVVEYKNKAISEKKEILANLLDPEFKPLQLTEQEINNITLFIENSLFDPNLRRYAPKDLPSGLCFPNADLQSRREMKCF